MEDIECCHDHDFVVLTDVIEDGTTPILILALFSSEKWNFFGTVALSFVCDKYYPIIGSNDSSRDLQLNCVICETILLSLVNL